LEYAETVNYLKLWSNVLMVGGVVRERWLGSSDGVWPITSLGSAARVLCSSLSVGLPLHVSVSDFFFFYFSGRMEIRPK